jgi:hypothetical protein
MSLIKLLTRLLCLFFLFNCINQMTNEITKSTILILKFLVHSDKFTVMIPKLTYYHVNRIIIVGIQAEINFFPLFDIMHNYTLQLISLSLSFTDSDCISKADQIWQQNLKLQHTKKWSLWLDMIHPTPFSQPAFYIIPILMLFSHPKLCLACHCFLGSFAIKGNQHVTRSFK